jgi:hypothetical protein
VVIDGLHEFHKRGRIFHINQIERGLGMSTNNIHETQPEKEHLYSNDNYVDENLRSIQSIEGGGPMKKNRFKFNAASSKDLRLLCIFNFCVNGCGSSLD